MAARVRQLLALALALPLVLVLVLVPVMMPVQRNKRLLSDTKLAAYTSNHAEYGNDVSSGATQLLPVQHRVWTRQRDTANTAAIVG